MLMTKLAFALLVPLILAAPLADPTLLTARTSESLRERDVNQELCSAARVPAAICTGYIAFLHFFRLYPNVKRDEISLTSPLQARDSISDFCKLYHLSMEDCKALFKFFELIGTNHTTAPLVARDETAIATGVEERDLDQDLCRASFVPASVCSIYINFLKIYHIYPGSATKRDLAGTTAPLESRDLDQDLCRAALVPSFLCPSYITLLKIYHIYPGSAIAKRGANPESQALPTQLEAKDLDQDICRAALVPSFLCPSYITLLKIYHVYPGSTASSATKRDELTSALEPRTLDQDICRIALVPSFLCPLYIILLKINHIYPALDSRSATPAPTLAPAPLDVSASPIPTESRDAGQDLCAQYNVPALLCPAIIAFFNKFGNISGGGGLGGGLLARRDLAADIPELIQYCHTLSPLPTLCAIVIREVERDGDGDGKVNVDEIRDAIAEFLGTLGVGGTAGPVLPDPMTFVARERRDVSAGVSFEERGVTIDAGIALGNALTFGSDGGQGGIFVAKEK